MRYVVPDIHGGFKAFKQCLELVNFDYDNDEIICLGDYFDGWYDCINLIKELFKIKNKVCLFGNHDIWVQDYLLKRLSDKKPTWYQPSDMECWVNNRGQNTKDEIDKSSKEDKDLLIQFLSCCKYYHIDEINNLYVHAGFDINLHIKDNYPYNMIWDRRLARFMLDSLKFKHGYGIKKIKKLDIYNEVYLGHTPCGHIPVKAANVNLLDTGCGYGEGRLTIMNIETKEYKQSDKLNTLY